MKTIYIKNNRFCSDIDNEKELNEILDELKIKDYAIRYWLAKIETYFNNEFCYIEIQYENCCDKNVNLQDLFIIILEAFIEKGYIISKQVAERLEYYKREKAKRDTPKEVSIAEQQDEYEYFHECPVFGCFLNSTADCNKCNAKEKSFKGCVCKPMIYRIKKKDLEMEN